MAEVPTIPTLPTAPNRQRPSTFAADADAWAGALPGWTTALRLVANFTREQAQAALAAAIAGNLSALDLSNLAGMGIGVNTAGDALEGFTPGVVLASAFDLSPNTLVSRVTAQPLDDFRWIAVLGGEDDAEYGTYLRVPRAAVTAEVVGTGVMYLGVINSTADTHQLYTVDRSDGTLAAVGSAQSLGSGHYSAAGMVFDGGALHRVIIDLTADALQLYTIDRTTGVLTAVGSAFDVGTNTLDGAGMAWDGSDMYLGVVNNTADTHQLYTVNQANGALAAVGSAQSLGAAAYNAASMAWDGSDLYIAIIASGALQLYTIDRTTGVLTAVGSKQVLGGSFAGAGMAWDGSDMHLGVVNNTADTHQLYTVDRSDGTLAAVGSAQSLGSGTFNNAGMAWSLPITGGAVAGTLRISRGGASEIGLRSTRDLYVHQVLGLP